MRFAGYAAVFDRPDRGGDVVRAGAFARSLTNGAGVFPLLWQHQAGRPIGRIEYLKEDKRGLRVIGRLADPQAAGLLRVGAVRGLSFGYRVREAKGEAPRELLDVELVEVSLVTFPMQPRARVRGAGIARAEARRHGGGAARSDGSAAAAIFCGELCSPFLFLRVSAPPREKAIFRRGEGDGRGEAGCARGVVRGAGAGA